MSERAVFAGAAGKSTAPPRPDAGRWAPPRIGTDLAGQVRDAVADLPWYLVTPLLRHWHRTWGATPAEVAAAMPGDSLLPRAQYRATRAITIDATPAEVWPWLVQVGYRRAGWYAGDLLDNFARPSVRRIVPELQDIRVGQRLAMAPKSSERTAFVVDSFAEPSWLLWRTPNRSWAWRLVELPGGRTRLITRLHTLYEWRRPLALVTVVLMECADYPMMRRMLRGIRDRAQAGPRRPAVRATSQQADSERTGSVMPQHFLEPAAQQFADATSQPPFLYELGPDGARKVLDDVQAAPITKPDVADKWITVAADAGDVRVRIVKPVDADGVLPAILYMHGGGWVLGNAATHDRLVRELAVGVNAAVVFVEYDRSPEARYPVAVEQGYATARWIMEHGSAEGLDAARLAVAGDSVGGNMTAALTILAKQRGDVTFVHQSMYYPVTDAGQDTDSYREFAQGPFLTAKSMAWFWNAYLPDESRRAEITASPLQAGIDQLSGLPEAFLIVDENDVLRDEGEAYGRKLTEAGVRTTCVRYNGILHDFMMLNPMRRTAAATGAIEQAIQVLRKALGTT